MITETEKLRAEGFEFYTFHKPELRTEFRERYTKMLRTEFVEFEETHCHGKFTTFLLGVRHLRGKAAAHAAMEGTLLR